MRTIVACQQASALITEGAAMTTPAPAAVGPPSTAVVSVARIPRPTVVPSSIPAWSVPPPISSPGRVPSTIPTCIPTRAVPRSVERIVPSIVVTPSPTPEGVVEISVVVVPIEGAGYHYATRSMEANDARSVESVAVLRVCPSLVVILNVVGIVVAWYCMAIVVVHIAEVSASFIPVIIVSGGIGCFQILIA